MDKKVSIILPVYKVSAYLEECIRSLMHQDYDNIEIIPVDDGSPDDCGTILDRLASEDSRIKPIHKQNGGAASARNAGLDAANGDYICFVDSDDRPESGYISHLLDTCEKNSADIAVCGFYYWTLSECSAFETITSDGIYTDNAYLIQFTKDWSCSLLWNKIYRREVIGSLRMEEGHRVDDEYFTYQIVMNSRKVVVTSPPLYRYRLRKSSVMQDVAKSNEPVMLDRIGYMTKRLEQIRTRFPELEELFFRDALDNLIRYRNHSKGMPFAQESIRNWINSQLNRVLKSDLSLKHKLGVLFSFYVKKPRFCGEQNSLETEAENYFS